MADGSTGFDNKVSEMLEYVLVSVCLYGKERHNFKLVSKT